MSLLLLYLMVVCGGVGILCGEVQIALGGGSGAALVIYVVFGWVLPIVCFALVTARRKRTADFGSKPSPSAGQILNETL